MNIKKMAIFYTKDNVRICESCFAEKETQYIICFIENGVPEFVGNRPFELKTVQEHKNFLFLLRSGIKKSIRYEIKP